MPRKQVNIGFRPEDYDQVLAAAEVAGQDVTGFCREAILAASALQPVEPEPAASNGSVVLPAAFFWTLAQPYIDALHHIDARLLAQEPPPAPRWLRWWQRWRPGRRKQLAAPQQITVGAVIDGVGAAGV